jgi:fatty-acyl-CoA synthase
MQVPMTPVRILQRAVKLYPKKLAVIDGDVRLTYEEVQKRVNRVTHAVHDLNISPGGRLAVLDYNSYRYMELYFGMAQSGRVMLPLNTRLTEKEYIYILSDAEAEAIIFHADFKPVIKKIGKDVKSIRYTYIAEGSDAEDWISGTYEDLLDRSLPDSLPLDLKDENQTLNLYYTSGTTGRPKGVMLTHRNVYVNALSSVISFKLEDTTVWHHIAPLFHIADSFFIWSVTLQGGRHIMQRQFAPRSVLKTMENEKVTSAMMVPTMINFLLNVPDIEQYDLSALQSVMVGGAPMSPANAEKMMEKLGCRYVSGYGLTETCPLLAVGNLKDTLAEAPEEKKLGHVTRTGFEVVGVDLRVVDKNGKDVPWDGKAVGEIIARGDNVMKGYWKLPDETAQSIRDGYFYTGDLANVDPEGYVFIVDRAKDIIVSCGENIASVELENVIYAHPDVLECAVIAVPDRVMGEVPKAMVVLKSGASASEKELIAFCRKNLARFKVPRYVEFVSELPKSGSGKILKEELRKIYAFPTSAPPSSNFPRSFADN